MFALIRLFWNICTLKRGPQDIPYSVSLFTVLFVLDMFLGQINYLIPNSEGIVYPAGKIFTYMLVDRIFLIVAVFVILSVHNRLARILQTLIALFGIDAILYLLRMPLTELVSGTNGKTGATLLFIFGNMMIFAGRLLLFSHIFRHSLDISIFRAGGYALFLFVLYLVSIKLAFPVSP